MSDIKLPRLPDRTPVKLIISIMPNLAEELAAYASLYKEAYGLEESLADLVPAILTAFLDGDRSFRKARERLGRRSDGETGSSSDLRKEG